MTKGIKGFQKGHKINIGNKYRIGIIPINKGIKRDINIVKKGVKTRMRNGSYVAWNKGNKKSYFCIDCGKEVSQINIKRCQKCMGLNRKGLKLSELSKEKMKNAKLKNPVRFWKGKKFSDEHKNRIGINSRLNKQNPEVINKIKKARATQILPLKDTKIELKIKNFCKDLKLEFFTHQYMRITNGYQCDILIPIQRGIEREIIIECDGDFIHCNPAKYPPDYIRFPNGDRRTAKMIWEKDEERTRQLKEKGYIVIRLWENEINSINLRQFKAILKLYQRKVLI